jgi:hypothetical protein
MSVHLPAWVWTAIGGAVLAWIVTQFLEWLKRGTGHGQPKALSPNDWDDDTIALIYSADALRKRLEVVEGTRIIVTHKRLPQPGAEFDTGKYPRREVKRRLAIPKILPRDGAMALQYRLGDFSLEAQFRDLTTAGSPPYRDVVATIKLKLLIDSNHPERLMEWHGGGDQKITRQNVQESVEAAMKPAVGKLVLAMNPEDLWLHPEPSGDQIETQFNAFLSSHGIRAWVLRIRLESSDAAAHRKDTIRIERQGNANHIEMTAARQESDKREFLAKLKHYGIVNDYNRDKEREDRLYSNRVRINERIQEGERVFDEDLKREPAGTQRHEILEELKLWRKRKKPFSVQLSIARVNATTPQRWPAMDEGRAIPPGMARDMGVAPPYTAADAKIGDTIQFSIKSEIEGFLYLLNLGTGGKVWRLLPNAYRTDNRIGANRTILVPDGDFRLPFVGPVGTEHVIAIVSPRRIERLERLPVNLQGDYPEVAARDIGVMGQEMLASDDWAEAMLAILVTDAQRPAGIAAHS